MSAKETRLLLLRHGEVASHRGDVPVTEAGLEHAALTGTAVGHDLAGPLTVLYGGTRRTRETAEALVRGIGDPGRVTGPLDSFALRNPDLYVAGHRVDMVSSPAALAEQVPGMTEEQVEANPWWTEFFSSPDRIGWWLRQDDPPGDGAVQVGVRVRRFAQSLAVPGPLRGHDVIAVTHSPLLRAVLLEARGSNPGEPGYVTGADVRISATGALSVTAYDPLAP